jgi:biopolymer transport protein ExbD
MAGTFQNGNGPIVGINVTPLVDIVLVLLIILIVTARIVVSPAVPLDLPKASKSEELQVIFSVLLPVHGGVFVNGERVADDSALLRRAEEAVATDPELRAVINADGGVPHREVMHALDLLKQAGIARVAFGAVPLEEEGRP